MKRQIAILVIISIGALFVQDIGLGQNRNARKATVIRTGKAGFWIDLHGDERQPLLLVDPMKTKIQIVGELDKSFLKKGHYLKFSIELDEKNKPLGPLEKVELVSLSEDVKAGLKIELKGKQRIGTGIGKITRISKNKFISFSFPRKNSKIGSLKIGITDKLDCKLGDFRDFTVARPGDGIEFEGDVFKSTHIENSRFGAVQVESRDNSKFVAEKLLITLKNALSKTNR